MGYHAANEIVVFLKCKESQKKIIGTNGFIKHFRLCLELFSKFTFHISVNIYIYIKILLFE